MRLSNMELLRVVSMLMVLAVHIDGASLGLPQLHGDLSALTARSAWQIGVESAAIVGVNCFTLISGFFGIRLRWRGVAAYLFQCIFYAVGIYTAVAVAYPSQFHWTGWLESWLVLTHTDLWYVPAYFGLMLLSPLLNAGFDIIPRRRAVSVTVLFALFNMWAGWWWGGSFNPTGYTLVQLVMMYMIGRCLALHFTWTSGNRRRDAIAFFALYLVLTAAISLHACHDTSMAYAYNSPLVVASSCALLLAFSRLDIRSEWINHLGRSAFAVYLIHKAPLIWGNLMRPGVRWMWANMSLPAFTVSALGLMASIYLLCMCADWLRRRISDFLLARIAPATARG